ncbi:GNAT family N-acetyltransferase [Pseudonocardia bannensis]|uniref:GNAT family N-acetyltransferase n=1 Tax=Pseudonocardia bannensis TaxID=630973 RepID=A0A848DEY4_9PSEU|nr:GNAT family N-acetyltransferase [Pseudonocardia bannensis]NMH91146.1 GNAT family N-acetyltransferase [Pseudonocardia bannensis]
MTARSTWLRCYVDAFPKQQPVAILVEEEGRLIALAYLGRVDGPVVEWTALGHSVSDYAALPAIDDDAARRLAEAIAEQVRRGQRPWRLRLEQLPAGDPVLAHLQRLLPHVHVRSGIPAIQLSLTEPRTLGRHMSKNARKTFNKGWNRLRRDGHEADLRLVRDPAEVAGLLDRVVTLRRNRDHQLGRRSDFDDPEFERFYRDALSEFARRGELELTVMLVGDELIGYVLGFLDGPIYRTWDGRVASRWMDYSAGRICDSAAIGSALADERFTTWDWMRGEQAYKRQSMTHVIEHQHLHAWSSAAVRHGYRVAAGIARRARRAAGPHGLRGLVRTRASQ